jgi:hypothetical protein
MSVETMRSIYVYYALNYPYSFTDFGVLNRL